MSGQVREVGITGSYGDNRSEGVLTVVEYDKNDRMRRAVGTALKVLGITFLCVFIPGAHFVLVPLGILLTPVLAYVSFRVKSKIANAQLSCPQCGAPLTVLSSQAQLPLEENCVACRRPIRIAAA